jgi:hypothetical protein
MDSPISKFMPDILRKVFQLISRDCDATLVPSILCCKEWRPLAESVLYEDVSLNEHRLPKFLNIYTDRRIRSLTVVMDRIPPVEAPETTMVVQRVTSRLEALQRLSSQVKKMALVSLSITINLPEPFTASLELSSILNNLPDSCTSLEIDARRSGAFIPDPGRNFDDQPSSHFCESIRTILPRLRHLRLRRPELCFALFGTGSPEQGAGFKAVRARNLKSCLINLALNVPTVSMFATSCGSTPLPGNAPRPRFPSALPPLLPRLQDFAHLNSASLEQLCIIDVQTRDPSIPNSWAAWVRRDILSDTSVPIPVGRIRAFHDDGWLARVPTGLGYSEDWVSFHKYLETLAEGSFWTHTTSKIRLPTPLLREYDRVPIPLTKEQYINQNRRTYILWQNEEATGEKLLPEAPGPLMQVWDLKERTPKGWTRDNYAGSPVMRERDILMESLDVPLPQ